MTLVVVGMVLSLLAGILIGMLAVHLTWRTAKWSLSQSTGMLEHATERHSRLLDAKISIAYEQQKVLDGAGVVAKQLALLTTASEKLEKVVAHLYLQSQDQGSHRNLRDPNKETQRGEEAMLPFPPGTQRTKLPEQQEVKDGFDQKEIQRPGILKNRDEPARGAPS